MPRLRSARRLVVPPATVQPVRPRRLLRLLTRPARERARRGVRAPADPELRTWRGLVLGLPEQGLLRRSEARRSPAPPGRPADARPGRTRTFRLAAAPALGSSSRSSPERLLCGAPGRIRTCAPASGG